MIAVESRIIAGYNSPLKAFLCWALCEIINGKFTKLFLMMMRSPWTIKIFTIYPTFANRWQSATFPRAKPDSRRMSRFGLSAMTRAPISAKTRYHVNFQRRQLFACVINDVLMSLVGPCREYQEATSSVIVAWIAFPLVYFMYRFLLLPQLTHKTIFCFVSSSNFFRRSFQYERDFLQFETFACRLSVGWW